MTESPKQKWSPKKETLTSILPPESPSKNVRILVKQIPEHMLYCFYCDSRGHDPKNCSVFTMDILKSFNH
jgi:hypothetical protein